MDPPAVLLSPQSQTCTHLAETCMEQERSPPTTELGRDSSFPSGQLPSSSLTDADWFWDEHIQAKRARVETIVQGMCLSPSSLGLGRARESSHCPEKVRERKRKQSLPMHQGPLKSSPAWDRGPKKGDTRVKEQLHLLKQQLRHLQEHVLQATEPRAPAQGPGGTEQRRSPLRAKWRNSFPSSAWTVDSKPNQSSSKDTCGAVKPGAAEVLQQSEEPMLRPSGPRALVETLRKELSRAVSQAVDSVLQQVLLDPLGPLMQRDRSCQGLASEGRSQPSPSGGSAYKDPLALATLPRMVQPQAAVPLGNSTLARPLDSPMCPVSPRGVPKPYQSPLSNCPLTAVPSHVWENQILSQLLGRGPNGHWSGSPPQDTSSQCHTSPESAQQPWGLSQQQLPLSFTPVHLESRPLLPSVKMERALLQGMADTLPFSSIHISFTGHACVVVPSQRNRKSRM